MASVASYASTRNPAFVARDGRSSLVTASLRASAEPNEVVDRLTRDFAGRPGVRLGGADVTLRQTNLQAAHDLGFAEMLALPLLALLAVVIFTGVAALLPLGVGVASVLGSMVVLRIINAGFPLSSFSLNVVTGLGLGLAIDYSLILLSRFREELALGADTQAAVRSTMATAGRTVIFSALTVAAAMASLGVFSLRFLQSIGIGGAVVALMAAATSLVLLPALFMLLGARLGRSAPAPATRGGWHRLAAAVMRRPGLVAAATVAVLLALAAPVLHTSWSGTDASVLPASQSSRVVADAIGREFPPQSGSPMILAARAPANAGRRLQAYAGQLARIPGITAVSGPRRLSGETWQLDIYTAGAPIRPAAQRALGAVRALPSPYPTLVGGPAAAFHDQQASIAGSLPLALAILAASTLAILWLMTGSVILPVKALVMNALTVGAALGLLVFVFQDGRLQGALAYTSQGGIQTTDFLVLAAIAFGLSTDYGVFLLTRIKESSDGGLDNREAVAAGLQRTGRIVTAGAIMVAVALGAFATSHVVFLKELGVGTAAAVLIDAFLIRALLVPALMALLQEWNWWSPAPLRRLHERLDPGEVAPRPLPARARARRRATGAPAPIA